MVRTVAHQPITPQTGEVVTMDTVVTIVSILASLAGAVLYLDRKIVNLDHKIDTLRLEIKNDTQRLDDRVFALAAGMKPLIEQAQRTDAG